MFEVRSVQYGLAAYCVWRATAGKMINGPDCPRLCSAGHRRKASEALLEWQEEHGPSPDLAPLNNDS
eukprot:1044298-Lingulodinium_polyedra.AAC.1